MACSFMIGVVLSGGASARFGGRPKGLIALGGRPMALRVADLLAQFCASVVIEAPRGAGYESLDLPLVHAPPEHAGKGPLAGIAAGLAMAEAGGRIAFAPCDMPFLTRTIYDELIRACANGPGAYARTSVGEEPLVAVLSAKIRGTLGAALENDDLPRTHKVLDAAGTTRVLIVDTAAFANVNSPDEHAAAEARLTVR